MLVPSLCFVCKHYRGARTEQAADGELFPRVTCAAFPNSIPQEIIREGGDHRKPWPGDNQVQFELAEGKELPLYWADEGSTED